MRGLSVLDLGCGTGRHSLWLAAAGAAVTGVDFSPVALVKAAERGTKVGVAPRLIEADLRSESIPGVEGTFDLLLDYGTLDDLTPTDRPRMVAQIERLARAGSWLIEFCFYGRRQDLPWMSFTGPSRAVGTIEPEDGPEDDRTK